MDTYKAYIVSKNINYLIASIGESNFVDKKYLYFYDYLNIHTLLNLYEKYSY